MISKEYHQYLQGPEWKIKSITCIAKAGRKCEACSATNNLQAHHLTYRNIFNEPQDDLLCLCGNCHKIADKLAKKGIIPRIGSSETIRKATLSLLIHRPTRNYPNRKVVVKHRPIEERIKKAVELLAKWGDPRQASKRPMPGRY